MNLSNEEIFSYHLGGKISVALVRALASQRDLSVAYTPGVGRVCQAIAADPGLTADYTLKGNCVAVVTDGTAVLGFGDLGPDASIPVMEGKAALFKAFAGVNAWPVPLQNARVGGRTGKTDPQRVIDAVAAIAPMYGGINLEDIAAPACFEIEDRLESMLDIPVFHDDQWGTAIITLAAVWNYCIISRKKMEEIAIVINGAGAAGIRIAEMLRSAGAQRILLCDSKGVVHTGRGDLNEHKRTYAVETGKRSLAEAMEKADVFIGVSVRDCVTPAMVRSMNEIPAIFAMANPDPEIRPEQVAIAMEDRRYIMATGRSDYPNQINNVLGFPYIFRGALDAKARNITMEMKTAAARALAELARAGGLPESVLRLYGRSSMDFGPDYLVPAPFDPRLDQYESAAVASAALKQGNSAYATKQAPEVWRPETEENLLGAVVRGLSCFGDRLFASLEHNGRSVILELARRIHIGPVELDLHVEPGRALRLLSLAKGKTRTRVTGVPSLEKGLLAGIGTETGWI